MLIPGFFNRLSTSDEAVRAAEEMAKARGEEVDAKIALERVGDTFEMVMKTRKLVEETKKYLKWTEDGGKKFAGMEVDANEEESGDEEGARRIDGGKEGEGGLGGGCWNGSELQDGAAS